MADCTRPSMPIDPYASEMVKRNIRPSLEYKLEFIGPAAWTISGTGALANYGSNLIAQIFRGVLNADVLEALTPIPRTYDRGKPIYVQVVFTGSAVGARSITPVITYNPISIKKNLGTCTTTNASTAVTNVYGIDWSKVSTSSTIGGSGIATAVTIDAFSESARTMTLSANATASASNVGIWVGATDDGDIAPATALDETIPTAWTQTNVDLLDQTFLGKIDGGSIDADEEFISWLITIGVSAGNDWGIAGLKVYWPTAADE